MGLVYELLKKEIPSDLVPEEVRWISNALNDLSVEQDLVPSLGVIWRVVPKKLTFRGELFRIMQLQSGVPSGMRNQTVALGIFNFKPSKSFDLSVGLQEVFRDRQPHRSVSNSFLQICVVKEDRPNQSSRASCPRLSDGGEEPFSPETDK